MPDARLIDEAQECRQQALAYVGRPESAFLLKVAHEFERLARQRSDHEANDPAAPTRRE